MTTDGGLIRREPTLREAIEMELKTALACWMSEAARGDDPAAIRKERLLVRELRAALAELNSEAEA